MLNYFLLVGDKGLVDGVHKEKVVGVDEETSLDHFVQGQVSKAQIFEKTIQFRHAAEATCEVYAVCVALGELRHVVVVLGDEFRGDAFKQGPVVPACVTPVFDGVGVAVGRAALAFFGFLVILRIT